MPSQFLTTTNLPSKTHIFNLVHVELLILQRTLITPPAGKTSALIIWLCNTVIKHEAFCYQVRHVPLIKLAQPVQETRDANIRLVSAHLRIQRKVSLLSEREMMKYLIGQDKNKQISSIVLNYESACAHQSYCKNKLTKQNPQI